HLYVNLRCMNIRNDIAYIFAGGGLMPQSDLQKEWEEIQAKANTLLSVLKENYHDV
ncbi:MAG TPA: isochorismate synthase, partial [Bacteroidales bacterium]|nr:isochorismate synthase [Bacteroidales bacterium]